MNTYMLKIDNTWSTRAAASINSDYPFLPEAIKDKLKTLANSYNAVHRFHFRPEQIIVENDFDSAFSDFCQLIDHYYNGDVFFESKAIENRLQDLLHDNFPRGTQAFTKPQKTLITGLRNTLIKTRAAYKHRVSVETSRLRLQVTRDAGRDHPGRTPPR